MWSNRKPEFGDQIRVNRGLYYHYGIYSSDQSVFQFAAPEGVEINFENAIVHETSLLEFLKGGTLEVRDYTTEELKKKRSPSEIIEYAKACVGEKGYDLVSNNCEHFANRCTFGESSSSQIDDVFKIIGGLFKWE